MYSNIVVTDNHITLKNKEYERFVPGKELIREHIKFDVSCNTAYANAIRRMALEGLYAYHLTFNLGEDNINIDLNSDDYVIDDYLRDRLSGIVLNQPSQDLDLTNSNMPKSLQDCRFEIDVENETTSVKYVYSKDIVQITGPKIQFHGYVRITAIQPGKRLHIKNIHLAKTLVKNNGNAIMVTDFKFIPTESVNFNTGDKLKNWDEMIEAGNTFNFETNIKSGECFVTKYHIEFTSLGVKSMTLLENVKKSIVKKFKILLENSSDSSSDLYTIITETDYVEITIFGETYTVGNLIRDYMYELDENIPYVAFKQPHPLKNEISIIVKHPEWKKLYFEAIKLIIRDFSQ
jgi:DNA-directed RNA polymerase subunit L